MPSVVISDELRDQLRAAEGPVELVDSAGEWVGWVDVLNLVDPTPEELAAAAAGPGKHTTAEVLAYCRAKAGQ